jgi:HSP20 family protein
MFMRLNDIDQMFNAMDTLQKRLAGVSASYRPTRSYLPAWNVNQNTPGTNLYDAGENLEMKIEVPGIAKEDMNIKIQGNYLEISGKKAAYTPEGYAAHRVERGATSFTRSFTLPADVDSAKVEARLDNGLLSLTLPKAETAKPRQIAIN